MMYRSVMILCGNGLQLQFELAEPISSIDADNFIIDLPNKEWLSFTDKADNRITVKVADVLTINFLITSAKFVVPK